MEEKTIEKEHHHWQHEYKFIFYGYNHMTITINKRFDSIGEAYRWGDEYMKKHHLNDFTMYLRMYRNKRRDENGRQ